MAKESKPLGFVLKPFQAERLYEAIEIAFESLERESLLTVCCSVMPPAKRVILLVDDQQETLDVTKQVLEAQGYSTKDFNDSRLAVEWFARHYDRVSLVLLDLQMPHLGGILCLGRMLSVKPDAQIVIWSGVNDEQIVKQALDLGAIYFLQKPFRYEALLELVRDFSKNTNTRMEILQ